jgi:hypothetical protein
MAGPVGKDGLTQAELIRAFGEAQASGDPERIERAALALPSGQSFGTHPGQIPALVHQAYAAAATPASRSRLAAALARAWVYGGDAARATGFADEAVALAPGTGDPTVLAVALDAALLARWGPDAFADRLRLSAQLADTAAHLAEPAPRLTAHLWRLTTAWECLDLVAVQRQLRALDLLAQESGSTRIAFFAAARRAMHALVTAGLDAADELIARTSEIGAQAAEPDLMAVEHSLAAARARRAGDTVALRREAASFAEYGAAEGVPSVSAEAAVLWLESGEPGPALALLQQLAGGGLDAVARDVDFLLTVASLVQVAAALHREDLTADGIRLLTPYAGRAVLNAGAVVFHGVVDDYLYRACQSLGQQDTARWRHLAAASYQRIGAAWWHGRLSRPAAPRHTQAGAAQPSPAPAQLIHLRRDGSSGWAVGRDGATAALPDLKGLHYLRLLIERPGVDVAAPELAAAVTGAPAVTDSGAGELIDRQALAAYRQRLAELDGELDEARSWSDEARLARLRLEREALLGEVRAAAGLAGRGRRFGSAGERARIAVRKAIAAALDRIGHHDPALARLLRDTVHTGAACRYDPDPARPVRWRLS